MIFPLLLLSLVSDLVVGEVITLRKGKNVTCVLREDGSMSGVYLTPNSTKILSLQNLNSIYWLNNDWKEGVVGDYPFYHPLEPLTDIRWNDLPEYDPLVYHFPGNLSFSVCSRGKNIDFEVRVKHFESDDWIEFSSVLVPTYRRDLEDYCSWVHFTVWTRNNELLVTSENITRVIFSSRHSIQNCTTEFNNPLDHLVKIHYYWIFWSHNPTLNGEESSFQVQTPDSKNICLNLFVSIDEGCQLVILLVSPKANLTETIEGFNKPRKLKIWQNRKITFNFSGIGRIYLNRKTTLETVGFWAIDLIRYCSENNAVVFKTSLDTNNETARCQQIQKEVEYESTWLGENMNAGCLGNKCEITCGDILGKSYSYCQEHTICSNNKETCFCSAGYESSSDDGQCLPTSAENPKILIIVLPGVMILLITCIGGFYLYFFYYKRKSLLLNNTGQPIVIVNDFDDYVKKSLAENSLNSQFESLANDKRKECKVALSKGNMKKNYDADNIPYDKTRVVLKILPDIGYSDYINASYIDGCGRPKAYIVTQGPKASTMADFWRMIWQHDVKIIVMATQFRENMERKCFEYFPTYLDAVLPVEDFGIKLLTEESTEFYHKRTLEIYYQRYHKTIKHYQLKWSSDCGKALYPNNLVPLVKIMNENYSKEKWSPIVVHCQLGVERSAILVLSDLGVQMAKNKGNVDVFDLAKMLRQQRPNMITSAQDYLLAHLVISECLMDENNSEIRHNLNTCTWHDNIICSTPFPTAESYEKKTIYIPLKQPRKDDIKSFWLTVLQEKIKTIIFLNHCSLKLWPFEIQLSDKKICNVTSSSSKESSRNSYCEQHQLLIKEKDMGTTTLYEEEIQFYHLLNWNFHNSSESTIETFIQFVEDCRNLNPIPDKILICCSDGITGCGLFMATSYVIAKYIKEIKYDVFNAIRNIKRTNLRFISKEDEVRFLYKATSVYSQKFDPYNSIYKDLL